MEYKKWDFDFLSGIAYIPILGSGKIGEGLMIVDDYGDLVAMDPKHIMELYWDTAVDYQGYYFLGHSPWRNPTSRFGLRFFCDMKKSEGKSSEVLVVDEFYNVYRTTGPFTDVTIIPELVKAGPWGNNQPGITLDELISKGIYILR